MEDEEEEYDDFTFPTVVDAARAPDEEGQPGSGGDGPVATAHLLQFPVLPDLAAAPSPLWPFAASSSSSSSAPSSKTVDDEQAQPVSGGTTGRGDERRGRAAADEESMDLLWDWEGGATAAPAASEPDKSRGDGHARHAGPPKQPRAQAEDQHDDDDKQRAAAVADAERMDKLWESFNNDDPDRWFLCDYRSPSTDAGAESASSSASPAAPRRGYGCAPAMLRASSRAGGAAQFCPRGGRRRRGAAAGWALLLRLFRRLFAVDKTSRSPRGGGTYVP